VQTCALPILPYRITVYSAHNPLIIPLTPQMPPSLLASTVSRQDIQCRQPAGPGMAVDSLMIRGFFTGTSLVRSDSRSKRALNFVGLYNIDVNARTIGDLVFN